MDYIEDEKRKGKVGEVRNKVLDDWTLPDVNCEAFIPTLIKEIRNLCMCKLAAVVYKMSISKFLEGGGK